MTIEDAWDKTFHKWFLIAQGYRPYDATLSCGLCNLFAKQGCSGCPIFEYNEEFKFCRETGFGVSCPDHWDIVKATSLLCKVYRHWYRYHNCGNRPCLYGCSPCDEWLKKKKSVMTMSMGEGYSLKMDAMETKDDRKIVGDFSAEPPKKCIVRGCKNHTNQGTFVGDLCYPCWEYLALGKGDYSQAKRNLDFIEEKQKAKCPKPFLKSLDRSTDLQYNEDHQYIVGMDF